MVIRSLSFSWHFHNASANVAKHVDTIKYPWEHACLTSRLLNRVLYEGSCIKSLSMQFPQEKHKLVEPNRCWASLQNLISVSCLFFLWLYHTTKPQACSMDISALSSLLPILASVLPLLVMLPPSWVASSTWKTVSMLLPSSLWELQCLVSIPRESH